MSNTFIVFKITMSVGVSVASVILTSASWREKERRNGNLCVHLYMYLDIYSQSVTLRRAHLAAAVSGNL